MNKVIKVSWQCVPNCFHYFREAVQACGETRILKYNETLGRHVRFVEIVTEEQLMHLIPVYEKLLMQDELNGLWNWLERASQGSEFERGAAWYIGGILMVFSDLAENDVSPFSRKRISPSRPKAPLQGIGVLIHLPDTLSYLIGPAMKYGRYQFENQMSQFLEHATSDELEELAIIAERVLVNDHYPEVNRFLDRYRITEHEEAANLYFLFNVLDCAGFQFDRASEG
jgi:hypothetical protein